MEHFWYIYIIIIILLILLSSFFSSAETALTSLNLIRLKSIAKRNNNQRMASAKTVFKLVKNYNLTLTTILVANTVINLVIGTMSTILFVECFKLGTIAPIISTIVSAILVLIIGEIVPKSFAKIHPEKVALNYAYILYALTFLFYPLIVFVNLFQVKTKNPTSSEQELIELVKIIEREGVLEKAERDLIESAIKFDEKSVFQAMQNKSEIKYIYENTTAFLIKQLYLREKYTRIPVLDSATNKVVGILNIKDYISEMLHNRVPNIGELITEPLFLSKRTKLNQALEILQSERTHMAIVCNNKERRDFAGIITLEDILEELVGEIYDETDQVGPVQEVGTHKFLVEDVCQLELLFQTYLKSKPPRTKQSLTLGEWYKRRTRRKRITKSGPILKYQNFIFKVDKIIKSNKIIFEVEILTNQQQKNDWE